MMRDNIKKHQTRGEQTLVGQTLVGQTLVGQTLVGQTIVCRSRGDQNPADQNPAEIPVGRCTVEIRTWGVPLLVLDTNQYTARSIRQHRSFVRYGETIRCTIPQNPLVLYLFFMKEKYNISIEYC